MVKEIDGYKERKIRKEKESKKFEEWFMIASEIFQKPLYKITKNLKCLDPSVQVYFETPNDYVSINCELLQKADLKDIELYNSLVVKCNLFSGCYAAVDIHPWIDSIDAVCPEVYQDARRLAGELEKRLKVEVSLRTTYPKE